MKQRRLCYLLLGVLLTACARQPSNPKVDPYENFNRVVFAFNTDIEHLIFRPVARLYNKITPNFLQHNVTNFFDNIETVTTIPNDLLQGKFRYALVDTTRLLTNTIFGIAGLFDVASDFHLPKHYEDFGMTIAYWQGGTPSSYLVLPFLGPNTLRSSIGLPFDYYMSPWPYIHRKKTYYTLLGLRTTEIYNSLIPAYKLINEAFDPYIFVRHAYLNRRNKLIAHNKKDEIDRSLKAMHGHLSAKDYGHDDFNTDPTDLDNILEPGEGTPLAPIKAKKTQKVEKHDTKNAQTNIKNDKNRKNRQVDEESHMSTV